jgi:demethylmenaquinone methyltransferase/2-methoxy-6-polyprenyl-1,4-benzoquinol methylase
MAECLWSDDLLSAPHDVEDKGRRVRGMFDAIAPRYDLVNSVFSLRRDAFWRRRAVALAGVTKSDVVLDIACGTGALTREFRQVGAAMVVGVDFAHQMLVRAADGRVERCTWCEADAMRLPFRSATFTVVGCAFGVRNLRELDAGLREMHRVLRPGGRAVVLEFSRPKRSLVRRVYELYSGRLMPRAASWLSGDRTGAYRYLPKSIATFPDGDGFCERMIRAGFHRCRPTALTGGIVTIYLGWQDA